MLYYPQLTTGAVAQFPVTRSMSLRTVTNQLASGLTIRMADTGLQQVQWRLSYSGLNNDEQSAIESLFEASQGQLNTFTFLDPTDNLLMWSEDWTQAVWTPDPLLEVSGGFADALGGSDAMQLTNGSETTQQILQITSAPSAYVYCFSVYVRSNVPVTVQLVASTTGQTSLWPVTAGGSWTRATVKGSLTVEQDNVAFGLQLPGGAQMQAFGAQVEAQPQAGAYKKTIDRAGVYPSTRFSSDSLSLTATAPNQNSCAVELISRLN